MENLICFWLISAWHFFKPTSSCVFPYLGEVTTLTGLNIGDNPLRFPTQDIISQGVVEILKYLRLMLLSKSNGSFRPGSQLNGSSAGSPSANGDADHADSDSDEDPFSAKRIRTRWVPCGFCFSEGTFCHCCSAELILTIRILSFIAPFSWHQMINSGALWLHND